MAARSLSHYQLHRQETLWLLTEAARAEGRVQGRVSPEAYQTLKNKEQEEYRDPEETFEFWTRAERRLDADIYDLAKETVETKQRWEAGEVATVWQGKRARAYIKEGGRDGGGVLFLIFQNGGADCAREHAGILNPLKGWMFTMSRADYGRWVEKARRLVK